MNLPKVRVRLHVHDKKLDYSGTIEKDYLKAGKRG
jgi:hypothetical protein